MQDAVFRAFLNWDYTLCSCEVIIMQPVRRFVLALCLVVASCCSNAGAEGVTFNVYYRVLMIQTTNGQGTGFTLDVDGRQYLITAKHMVAGLHAEDTIKISKYDASRQPKWVDFKMKIFKCDDPVDIAVLVPRSQLTVSMSMEPVLGGGPVFGQDVFFVGFPSMFMKVMETTFEMTSPFGYIKRAVVSGVSVEKRGGTLATQYVLDGHNIGGFSGSPVVYRPNGNGDLVVVAVISGFKPDLVPILAPREIKKEEATPEDYGQARIVEKNGRTYRLEEAKEMKDQRYVLLNTGIAYAWDIHAAVDLIHLHPDGPAVSADFRPSLAP
jgi:trypsin-like peptidase